ncbi:MAG: arylsulfatase [Verrucomicrobiota bacterium]
MGSRFLSLVILCAAVSLPAAERPNVLVILTDDQGWGDLSFSGNKNLATPHIDSLAEEGISLEAFYVCQVCAPTRAEFLTGRYHPRTGVSGVTRGQGRLNPDETTVADVFSQAGYATGCFGKWHNGTQPPYHPNDRGFDEFYGFTSGHWSHYFDVALDHNGERVRSEGFMVDDITDRAVEFIGAAAANEQPFFCYVPFNTPHSPMMVPDRWYQKFENLEPEMRHHDEEKEDLAMTRAALALCENIDWNVGRLLSALEESGATEDTLVIFFSDNGPNSFRWNGGLKGRKGSIDEGGLRSACFVRWPDRIAAGRKVHQIAGAIDLLPTLVEAAELPFDPPKPLDGKSLVPLLVEKRDKVDWPERELFSIRRNQVSIRTQRFRYDAEGRLFDVAKDPGQLFDLAAENPATVLRLSKLADQFRDEMQQEFAANSDRPFTVGFGQVTQLPVRDAIAHGGIQRSSKAPNNSFLHSWSSLDDFISWDAEVGQPGRYEVELYYTCAEENVGCLLTVSQSDGEEIEKRVTEVYDPPLYVKDKERVAESHYFMKDFAMMKLGEIDLSAGRGSLRLGASEMPGRGLVDVHSIILRRL